ncbi:hypothetical protein FIU83_04975 [Halomonas sp. THAF5a]|uniref:hypothetical protein n=1 Tax=Halomonas sp. THAF5a TaxID=2587844 RepID=UPI0012693EBF|nr:hypothetical protein [Halomonas sp. THAF5a]QFU00982.1 hypothetical protein FIU83_04975 [Halomonas sp. THAF5a]
MDEIEMMPAPGGTWIMICPCGQTEIRGRGVKAWHEFEATMLPRDRYRVTCRACGRRMEHRLRYGAKGSIRPAPS